MMGFNKEKVLKKAEALAGKGKIEGAIKEFKKIVAKEGDDENILNRIGDLYKRLRKNEDAMTYWAKTADLYEHKGFYLKAIAVQKKIQRCDPGSLTSHRRLAELYHRQGLHNDARVHYQHLVDHYLRTNEGASAIGIYQKLIELEPENPTHRAKLAELYRQQQLTSKAIEEYVEIARLMIVHNEMDQALQVYFKALQIDPTDIGFIRGAVDSLKNADSLPLAEDFVSKAIEYNPDVENFRSELLPSDAPSPAAGSSDAIPGASTGGFELIDTDQADAIDSGMEVIQPGSGPIDRDFEPPIHESITPELPPIAPPSLTPNPIPSPSVEVSSASSAAGPEVADVGGLEEFVIEFGEDAPESMVVPPSDVADSGAPGSALSGEYDLGVEITLDGVEMPPQTSGGEENAFGEAPETGFELTPLEPEMADLMPLDQAVAEAAGAADAGSGEATSDDDAFELDLDSGFDLSDGDLDDFEIVGPQVGPPEDATLNAEPIAAPNEPAPLASPGAAQAQPAAFADESDLLLPAEEFSTDYVESAASDIASENVLELHEMDLSDDLEFAAQPDMALPTPDEPAPHVPVEPAPLMQRQAPVEPEPAASMELPSAADTLSDAPDRVPAEPAPLELTPSEPESIEALPVEPALPEPEMVESEPGRAAAEASAPVELEWPSQAASAGDAEEAAAEPGLVEASQPEAEVEPLADSSGMPAIADELQKVNDLLAEAEVFVKYGLQEKAVDRLSEVLRVDPRHLGAATQLIRLQLERGQHVAVAPLFNDLYEEVRETGAMELWDELKESLDQQGYVLEDEQIVALPGGLGLDGQPLAGADIDVADILDEPAPLTEDPVEGAIVAEIEAAAAGDQESPEAVAEDATGLGGLIDLGELGSEIDAEIAAEFESGSYEQVAEVLASDLVEDDSEVPAPPQPGKEPVAETLQPLEAVEGGGADAAALQPGLAWLNEPEATAEDRTLPAQADTEVLFEDEEQFFDLAAELQSEMAPETVAETPVSPEEQSLEEIVEGFKKGVSENLSSEDYDTHYNLGIAYREMMLLDEAIGEFQIAAKSDEYLVDCCAMLGLCFREKGLPDLAMKWYQRALESGLINEDQTLGMLYEMGSLHLERQERDEAYRTFVEIYGMNTNYRDVASKMAELAPAGA